MNDQHVTEEATFNRILAALSYFSIFFAGFVFPLIVWLISQNPFEKYHAKRAFISHLIVIPGIILFFIGLLVAFNMTTTANATPELQGMIVLGGMLLFIVLSFVLMIWNIVQGIKVLRV